jgi:DNA-binding transcriptional LysR family regulator
MLAQSFRLLEKAPLRLGVMSTVGHARLARFLAGFGKANPGVELAVTEMALADLVSAVDEGRLDAAVLTLMPDVAERFHTEPLYSERYIVVCPPGSPLEGMNAVTLADVSGADYVDRLACEMREMVMSVCGERGISLYARFRSEREDWVQAMVHAGLGFAFMPEYSVTLPGLVQRPLTEPEVTRQVALVTARGRPHTPAMAALVRASRSFAWPG